MTSYFHLLGLLAVADAGLKNADLAQALTKAGFAKSDLESAHKMLGEGEKLLEKYVDADVNRIADHNVHVAGAELEMWAQTVKFLLKKSLDAELIQTAMGTKIHAHDHTVTVVAQGLRLLAMIRADERIQKALGDERKVRDIGTRGWALLHRLLATTETRLDPIHPEAIPVLAEMSVMTRNARAWFTNLDAAARKLPAPQLGLLGLLGHVPDGIGMPVGGTGFSVVLHERGQTEAPDLLDKRPTSGWSIGRQGRNSENLGKGWVEPTF